MSCPDTTEIVAPPILQNLGVWTLLLVWRPEISRADAQGTVSPFAGTVSCPHPALFPDTLRQEMTWMLPRNFTPFSLRERSQPFMHTLCRQQRMIAYHLSRIARDWLRERRHRLVVHPWALINRIGLWPLPPPGELSADVSDGR